MKKKIIAMAAVIIAILFLSTFIEKNNVTKDRDEDSILMAVDNINLNFEKFSELSEDGQNIICATCRGLVKLNNNNEIVLDMAKDLEVSSNGIEYNFTLKDDIYWSNGEKVKSEDILIYFKYLIKKEDRDTIKALLNVYGVEKFKTGIGSFENDVAITGDGNNIKIRLNKKDDKFLDELSKPQYRIRRNISLWIDAKVNYRRILYSGEYRIIDINDSSIEMKKNGNEDGQNIKMIKDDSKEDSMASYEIGDRDIVVDPPVSQISRLEGVKRILSSTSSDGIYIAINSEKLDLQARKEIVKKLYNAAERYCDENKKAVRFAEGSYFQKEMDELNKLQSRKVSLNSGKEGRVPSKIKIIVQDNEVAEDFTKFIEDYFEESKDIVVTYEKEENQEEEEKEFDISILNLNEDFSDKKGLYNAMQQVFREQNKKYFTDESRIEESLFNSYIVVPIMFTNRNIAVSNKVSNIRFDGNGNIDFSALN